MSSRSTAARPAVHSRHLGRAASYGASAALLAVTLFPVLWLVQLSFKTDVEAERHGAGWTGALDQLPAYLDKTWRTT